MEGGLGVTIVLVIAIIVTVMLKKAKVSRN